MSCTIAGLVWSGLLLSPVITINSEMNRTSNRVVDGLDRVDLIRVGVLADVLEAVKGDEGPKRLLHPCGKLRVVP